MFHDLPIRGSKHLAHAQLVHRLGVALIARRDLLLVDLTSDGPRRLGLTRGELIESDSRSYPRTAAWARALHDHWQRVEGGPRAWWCRQVDRRPNPEGPPCRRGYPRAQMRISAARREAASTTSSGSPSSTSTGRSVPVTERSRARWVGRAVRHRALGTPPTPPSGPRRKDAGPPAEAGPAPVE